MEELIKQNLLEIMRNECSDGHTDGSDVILEFIDSLLKGNHLKWFEEYEFNFNKKVEEHYKETYNQIDFKRKIILLNGYEEYSHFLDIFIYNFFEFFKKVELIRVEDSTFINDYYVIITFKRLSDDFYNEFLEIAKRCNIIVDVKDYLLKGVLVICRK